MKLFAPLHGVLLALALAFAGAGAASAALTFPALSGRVVDDAHVLSPAVQADLIQKLGALEQATSRQVVVVTLPSLQGDDIADYGYQLGRTWGIGQKGLNNGLLFIVAPNERKVRIEVGYGLEPIVTDALSTVILQDQVLPKFRTGDYNGGVSAGVDALITQLSLDPSTAEQKAAQAEAQAHARGRSGGGNPIVGLIGFLIVIWVISSIFGGRGGWFLPGMIIGSLLGGGGGGGRFGRDDDGDSWGGGGGGSFGGGGSSGSW